LKGGQVEALEEGGREGGRGAGEVEVVTVSGSEVLTEEEVSDV